MKLRNPTRTLAALALGLSLSTVALGARADEHTSLEGLLAEEVVTSVSNSAESAHGAPAVTRSITAEEIRRYGMSSVAEALDFLGLGVNVERTLNRSEVTVRGVNFTGDRGNHVLVLLDGHSLNEPLIGDATVDQRLGIPLEMIDHVELVLGPGSAMYGSSAVLGVVNVVTKSAKTLKGYHVAAEAGAVGTLRGTLTTGQSFEVLRKRAELTVGLMHWRRDSSLRVQEQTVGVDPVTGERETWGGQLDRSYRSETSGMRLRFVREGLEVAGRAVVNRWGDPTGISDFDHPDAGTLERRTSLVVTQRFPLGSIGELSASIYGKGYRNRRRTIVSRASGCPYTAATCDLRDYEISQRVGSDLRADLDWAHDGRFVTALGAGTSLDRVDVDNVGVDYATGGMLRPLTRALDVASVWNVNANAQQTVKPLSWLDLIAGGRVDWRKLEREDGSNLVFTPVFAPRVAVAARPWTGATTKLIYAEAFRAPSPYESNASLPWLLRANNLRPERSFSVEAIFEQRIDAHRFTIGVFDTHYHGVIGRHPLSLLEVRTAYEAGLTPYAPSTSSGLLQYQPTDHIATHGFNAGFDGTLLCQRLHYGFNFTGAVARRDFTQSVLTAPQWLGNARVAYDLGGTLPTAALASSFAGPTASDRAEDAGFRRVTYAPASLEVRATLTGQVPWVKGLSYRAMVGHQAHSLTPYAVGPTVRASTGLETTPLSPTQRWNAILGLQYDFGD